jgi:hypothetical protein
VVAAESEPEARTYPHTPRMANMALFRSEGGMQGNAMQCNAIKCNVMRRA